MSTTIKQYKELETLILKSDLAALLARWEFGRKLLKERGDAKRLPNGRVEQLLHACNSSSTVAAYAVELHRRMQFAELYPSDAKVRAAFHEYGSWSEICARGIGEERRRQAYDARMDEDKADVQAVLEDPVSVLVGRIGGAITETRELLEELQKYTGRGDKMFDVVVRDMVALEDQAFARYEVDAKSKPALGLGRERFSRLRGQG
jgi:hypothetical protein